jgi:hypothetical protein
VHGFCLADNSQLGHALVSRHDNLHTRPSGLGEPFTGARVLGPA